MNSGQDQQSRPSEQYNKREEKNELQHLTGEIRSTVRDLDDSSGCSSYDRGDVACNGHDKVANSDRKNSCIKDDRSENANETDSSVDGSEEEEDVDESETDEESDEEGGDGEEDDEDDEDDDDNDVIQSFKRKRHRAEYFDSDSSDDQSERCPICLNRFIYQEIGTPESCDHNFCLDCIQEWARNVNTCPVDRQVFTLILVRPTLDTTSKISRKILIENKQLEEDEDVEEDQTFCEICGSSDREDRLLLCDGCDLGYHLECLDPPLDSVPVEEWFCPDCAVENQLPLAEEVDIREDELAGLLGDNPPDLGLPLLRPRNRRLVPRTRQSERVRRRIMRNRSTARNNGAIENQSSQDITDSRRTTKKKTVRKKRVTKRKKTRTRKKKKATKKIGVTGAKKITRKRRRRKKRKLKKGKKNGSIKARVILPLSIKARIANHLGLKKPPPGHSLPLMRSTSHPKTLNHQRYDVGIPTLNIFGSRDELEIFPESYSDGDVLVSLPSFPQAIPRNKLRASSLIYSHRRESQRNSFRISPQVPFPAHPEPVTFDVVGSILSGQSVLHTRSKDIAINRDGSLNVLPRFSDKQVVHQRPASPNPSSKSGGRTGTSNAPISGCPGQNYGGDRPGYGHWSSLLNENEANQAYAEYYRTTSSNDETRTYSSSGEECSGNNGHNTNAKEKNKKTEKEKKSVTAEYDDIDIYSDIEPGFENDEIYSGVEDSMATSMDLVQDDCINHSDISSEDDLVIDESVKQDDYDDNGEIELKQKSVVEHPASEENASSSSDNDLVIDEEPHCNKACENMNTACAVNKHFDEQNDTDSSDIEQVAEELEKVSQEFINQKNYADNYLEENTEKGGDSDDGNDDEAEEECNSDNDLASECSQSNRNNRISDEQEQSDVDIDVECVTEQEHSDTDVEHSSPQPVMSRDIAEANLQADRDNVESNEEQNDDADETPYDERCSDENEEVDVGSDHSLENSEMEEHEGQEKEYSSSSVKAINSRIQEEVMKSIEELNVSSQCMDLKKENGEELLIDENQNKTDQQSENTELTKSHQQTYSSSGEDPEMEKQSAQLADNLRAIMNDSILLAGNKDMKNIDYDHEIIEEGEIPNTEESERKKYRRRKDTNQHASSRRSHHTSSSRSHRDIGDHEEGEIVDDSPPRRNKDRIKAKNLPREVSPEEYDYDMPRKNISELPRIPKIKRDKTVKEGTEPVIPTAVDSKRTSVLSRLDIGSTNEISWKKLSKSSKERNYRDGKPKDETKYFREREIKEKKDEKKRKTENIDKKEKKPAEHERHKKDWPREKEKEKRDKRSDERDRHKEKHRNKHKDKEKERHKHNRPPEIIPEKRKERDRREREVHEKKPEKKDKEKKEKREKSRSGERSHRDEKHREHKKKVEKIVLASRETSPIESKEVYTSGDSIIVNVSFNRSLQREGKSREGKAKNKENRESKRNFPSEGGREHKKIRISEPEIIWSEKPKDIPLEKVVPKTYPPLSPPQSPPLPPPPTREHKRKPEPVRKEVMSPEPPRPSGMIWKPICEDEEEDDITEIVTSEKSIKSNEDSDSQDCIVAEDVEHIEPHADPELLPSDAENDPADDNESIVEIHSPQDKITEDSAEPIDEPVESPPSPTDDSVYDPFEPTKSPSLSPVTSETKSINEPITSNDPILPPPLPELPPLPPEPEPQEPPPPVPVNKDISHSSPSFTMQMPPKIPPQLSASPVSLPNVRVPPPNFIPRVVPPNGTTAMQIAPPLRPIGWPVGTPGVIYTAPAQSIIRGGFLPPTLSAAPVPVSTQSVSLNQIGTLLHTQAQLAILSAVRPPSGPPLSAVPPTIAIPPPLLSCPPPQMPPASIPIQQTISNTTQNGETRRPVVQQQDVTEVVDMEVESPYSPGEEVCEIPSVEKKVVSAPVHVEKVKDKFDLLLGTVKNIASRQQEKQPSHPPKGRASNDRAARQSSQQRTESRSSSNVASESRKRSSENYSSSSSSKKHIVRFEIPDRRAAQKKDKKSEDGGKKEVTLRLDETQLKILDELPSSAVEMQVKEKFLKKLNRQERVIEEVKLAIKPYYNRREISKEDYKEILRKSVPKICHNKSGEINPVKIRALVEGYVRKFKYHHKKETKFQPMGGKKS